MTRLERISRPVADGELASWIGRVARTMLPGAIKPNRRLSYRVVTPFELKAAPDLAPEDVDALSAWLAEYRKQQPTIDEVPLIGAYPRRPGLIVVDLGNRPVLVDDRALVLAGLGETLWANMPQSREPQPGIVLAQIVDPKRGDNQQLARTVSEAMSEAPAAVTLGELQMTVRTDEGLIEL